VVGEGYFDCYCGKDCIDDNGVLLSAIKFTMEVFHRGRRYFTGI
jgi:hypothetical protein